MKPAFSLSSLAILLGLAGCGENADTTGSESHPLRAVTVDPAANPAPRVPANSVLPSKGDITTSATLPPAPSQPELTPAQKQIVLNRMMNQMAKAQAEGLGGGTVTVNGAWQYSGYSYLSPNPDSPLPARLVAVDVTIEGHNTAFDIDDIEIIDGISKVSYGSDPHVTFLAGDAEPLAEGAPIPVAPAPTRALLIYAFPESTATFTLYYWGKNLLKEPMPFVDSGWGLPYPVEPN